MTANQRRPGFRLPWSSEMDAEGGEVASGGEDESMTPTPISDEHVADAAVDEPTPETAFTPETPAEPAAEMEAPAVAPATDREPAAGAEAPPGRRCAGRCRRGSRRGSARRRFHARPGGGDAQGRR